MVKSRFQVQSPERVLKQAQQFRQNLNQTLPLPINKNKSMYVEKVAEYNIKEVKYSIEHGKYQNQLFRKLQRIDNHNRKIISHSLLQRQNKIEENIEKNIQKQHKKLENYNRHFTDVQKKYEEGQNKKFQSQKQGAIKLRNQIKEFYEKQIIKKKSAQQRQVKVQTCYSDALEKINRIQKRNQLFAQKAQIYLQKSFVRNSPDKQSLKLFKLRSTSFDFRKSEEIYQHNQQILKQKQAKYIQKIARNQTTSLKAFDHKQEENQKVRKRISQKLKGENEKWLQQKKRIDEKNSQVPDKCTLKIERAQQSSFRNTFSTFKDSFSKWRNTGELNRSSIKGKFDRRKDEIMGTHLDVSLRNKSTKQVDQRMLSMKHRAKKVASYYL